MYVCSATAMCTGLMTCRSFLVFWNALSSFTAELTGCQLSSYSVSCLVLEPWRWQTISGIRCYSSMILCVCASVHVYVCFRVCACGRAWTCTWVFNVCMRYVTECRSTRMELFWRVNQKWQCNWWHHLQMGKTWLLYIIQCIAVYNTVHWVIFPLTPGFNFLLQTIWSQSSISLSHSKACSLCGSSTGFGCCCCPRQFWPFYVAYVTCILLGQWTSGTCDHLPRSRMRCQRRRYRIRLTQFWDQQSMAAAYRLLSSTSTCCGSQRCT